MRRKRFAACRIMMVTLTSDQNNRDKREMSININKSSYWAFSKNVLCRVLNDFTMRLCFISSGNLFQ